MDTTALIKMMGRSFFVVSLLPTALFVTIGVILFGGFMPPFPAFTIPYLDKDVNLGWVVVVLFIFWFSLFLDNSVNWIIKIYEGYYFPKIMRYILQSSLSKQLTRALSIYQKVRELGERITLGEATQDELFKYTQLREIASMELESVELVSPIEADFLLPTRLGNILRTTEVYAHERYGIAGNTFWPRLIRVLPSSLMKDIKESHNKLLFFLNSSILLYGLGVICLSISVLDQVYKLAGIVFHRYLNNFYEPKFLLNGFAYLNSYQFIIVAILFFLFGYICYRVGLEAAINYGVYIRTAFDLYRSKLLELFNLRLPKNSMKELGLWNRLSEHLIAGNRLGLKPILFEYQYQSKSKRKKSGKLK